MFDRKRPADHELILSPDIDATTRAMLMEGFENCAGNEAAAMFPHLPKFKFIAQTQTPTSSSVQKIRAGRITRDRAFLLGCEREGIPLNIEAIWLHMESNAGKENFKFKTVGNNTATTRDGKQVKKENLARVLVDFLKARKAHKPQYE